MLGHRLSTRKFFHVVSLITFMGSFFTSQSCSSGNGQEKCSLGQDDLPCSLRYQSACHEADGCALASGCAPLDCSQFSSAEDCGKSPICKWSGTWCGFGASNPCRDLTTQACGQQSGCVWGLVCTGQLSSCIDLNKTQCQMIPHCSWEQVPSLN